MPYTKIQLLAYVLNTGFGSQGGAQAYLGLADPAADIKARCALMQKAMETALTEAAPDPGTLKVFMAPEFFFRGNTGAYAMFDAVGDANPRPDAVSVVAELQAIAADPKWADWLFVFGSIIATSAPSTPGDSQEVYNLALIQAGGPDNAGEQGAKVVLKEWMSSIDFIERPKKVPATAPAGMLYADMVTHMTPASGDWYSTSDRFNYAVAGEEQQHGYDGGGIFEACGVRFGVEICLDHLQRRLSSAQLPGSPQVQVQLVPSCGMELKAGSIMAGPPGLMFGCDGLGYGAYAYQLAAGQAPVQINSHVTPVPNLPVNGGAQAQVPIASLFPTGAATGRIGVRPALAASDQDAVAGAIVVHDTVALPAAALVPGLMQTLAWELPEGQMQFTLLYDGDGSFRQALCRMLSHGCQLNRFWYALVPNKAVIMPYSDAQGDSGEIRLQLGSGAGPYSYGIWCEADLNAFQFSGLALEFARNITVPPESVGMTQPADAFMEALAS